MKTDLERFVDCMEYRSSDRRPNHELGVWPQTRQRWDAEAPGTVGEFTWNWFYNEPALGLDRRDYIRVNYGFIPPFPRGVLEDTPEYEVIRNANGIVTKALKAGMIGDARMCMDQYLSFPVARPEDFPAVKARLVAGVPERYPPDLARRLAAWRRRECPLVLGENCAANGFYWRAREFLGTEALSYAWYDYPDLMHEMMAFYADFIIETSRPVLEKIAPDYFVFNEDLLNEERPSPEPGDFPNVHLPAPEAGGRIPAPPWYQVHCC